MGSMIAIPFSVYMAVQNPFLGWGTLSGYLMSFFADPDIDLWASSASESRIVKYLPIIGFPIYAYSQMFGAIFRKKHRSMWTHSFLFGAFVRIVYFWWWVLLLFHYDVIKFNINYFLWFVGLWLGLSLGDSFHIFADMFWSESHFNKKVR